jgi:hypothetical protein
MQFFGLTISWQSTGTSSTIALVFSKSLTESSLNTQPHSIIPSSSKHVVTIAVAAVAAVVAAAAAATTKKQNSKKGKGKDGCRSTQSDVP